MPDSAPSYTLYARRSSEVEDRQAMSIEQQLEALRELARMRGFDVSEELTESASAKDPGRPVFGELMKRVRQGKIHGILVWRLDRLARNMVDGGELIHALSTDRLKVIVTPEATYTGTPDSKFLMAMLFGAAAKYSDDLAAAVRRGNEDVLRRGRVPGPVPLGYMKTHEHDPVGAGIAIPDPERFDTVKRLWQEALAGETNVTELWRKARDWGLTTRPTKSTLARPVALTNLYSILRNPFYAGKIKRGSTLYKGEHPPMITWDQFLAVQKVIGHRKREVKSLPDFLYRGRLVCGACGRHFTPEKHDKKSGRRYVYYHCSRHKPGYVICRAKAVREDVVTEELAEALDRVTVDPTIRDWAYEAIAWWADEGEPSPEKVVRRSKAALARAEQELATLTDLVIKDYVSEDEYKVRRVNQLGKIAHLREALAEPVERAAAWRATRDEMRSGKLGLGDGFRKGDAVVRRRILDRTVSAIVLRDGKAYVELRSPFVFRAPPSDLQSGLHSPKDAAT